MKTFKGEQAWYQINVDGQIRNYKTNTGAWIFIQKYNQSKQEEILTENDIHLIVEGILYDPTNMETIKK